MFNVIQSSLADLMRGSEDYKLIRNEGWLYLFPASVDFDILADHIPSAQWDQLSILMIDEDGRVVKNRYGAVSE